MKVIHTHLSEVIMLEPAVFGDVRGYFTEIYNRGDWESAGVYTEFVQDNHSFSAPAGTLRGLHYQLPPMAQTKLVSVLVGAIYDVAVDVRVGSASFGQWVGVILSQDNHRQLLIPKGFAHGFCTLVPNTHVLYKVDAHYAPQYDRGIRFDDPDLKIDWPFTDPVLSDKDKRHPGLQEAELS